MSSSLHSFSTVRLFPFPHPGDSNRGAWAGGAPPGGGWLDSSSPLLPPQVGGLVVHPGHLIHLVGAQGGPRGSPLVPAQP